MRNHPKYFKHWIRKTAALLVCFLLLSGICSSAEEDPLPSAQQEELLGWSLKLEKGSLKDSNLSFFKAVVYYRRFIALRPATLADLETRRFTAFDARRKIIDIFQFGLKNKQMAKEEFRNLLRMYADLAVKYPLYKINFRVDAKITQLRNERSFNAYLARVDDREIYCLLADNAVGSELIIYDALIPVARATIEKIIALQGADKDRVALARVYRINPAVKLETGLYARVVTQRPAANARAAVESAESYETGKKLFERQDFEGAEDYLLQAVESDPDNAAALNKLGLLYFSYCNLANARRYYLMALEADPAYLEAYIDLAGAYLSGEDFPVDTNKVFDMLEGAIRANCNYPRAYYWLGHLLDDFMFFEAAREYYQQGWKRMAVLATDNWYKQTSLAKKLSSPGQLIWDTANICLSDKEPMLNSSVYALGVLLEMDPADLSAGNRLKEIRSSCPLARNKTIYQDVISHRKLGLKLQEEGRLKEAIDEMRLSLYLDQMVSSKFRACIDRISKIKID